MGNQVIRGGKRQYTTYWIAVVSICTYLTFGGWLYLYFSSLISEVPFAVILATVSAINAIGYGHSWFFSGRHICWLEILGSMILACMGIQHALWYNEFAAVGQSDLFIRNLAQTFIYPVLLWTSGVLVGLQLRQFNSGKAEFIAVFGTTGFLAGIVLLGIRRSIAAEGGLSLSISADDILGTPFNYLALGDSLAIGGVFLIARLRRAPPIAMVAYVLLAVLLLQTRSRTSLALFLLAGACLLLTKDRARAVLLWASVVVVPAFVMLKNLDVSGINEVLGRIIVLVEERWADDSYAARIDMMRAGLHDLPDYWLFGRYMAEWWMTGTTGEYIHSILSYWTSYGVFVFVALSTLIVGCLRSALIEIRSGGSSKMILLAQLLYAVGAVVLARAYVWPFLWLSLGIAAGECSGRYLDRQNMKAAS